MIAYRDPAVALAVPTGGAAVAAGPAGTGPTPVVTRAGLDPALVAGRGATVDFVEQEAEQARDHRHRHRPRPRRLHPGR